MFRQSKGRVPPVPRDDEQAAIMDALLAALAAPAMTMTTAERSRIMGPRALSPGW